MAEGLYGGAIGRFSFVQTDELPAALVAEHILTLEAFAGLVRQLTWNGQARLQEAKLMEEQAASLRKDLPSPPAALSLGAPASDAGLDEPIEWLARGWRLDCWKATVAWEEFWQ